LRVSVPVVVLALLVGVAAGGYLGHFVWRHGGSGIDPYAPPAATEPPGEYLYLDSPRVATYLSQLEDGLKENEKVTLSHSNTAGANVGTSSVGLHGTVQSQLSLQETVTPTDASLFYRLQARLLAHHWLHSLNATPTDFATFRGGLAFLHEGSFVLIHNCRLVLPAYALPYSKFKQRIPSLPLTLTVQAPSGGNNVELLFPVAFNMLANEPSVYSSRLTVLGKIVRQVDNASPLYVDVETRAAYDSDLEHLKPAVFRSVTDASVERLEGAFSAAVTVDTPGAVILPIAIFK
jgi:hypothetical protein